MELKIIGGEMSQKEINAYREMAMQQHPDWVINKMTLKIVDDKYVDISYEYTTKSFDRIRRITGYLVGDLDRFNNAKRAEVNDRVKHEIRSQDSFSDVYLSDNENKPSALAQISEIKTEQEKEKSSEEQVRDNNPDIINR